MKHKSSLCARPSVWVCWTPKYSHSYHLRENCIELLQSKCFTNWDVFSLPSQRDFSHREELQQSDVEKWLGFITFLCEVFGTMRSSSGEPFRVLVCPIYTCLREVRTHISTFVWRVRTKHVVVQFPLFCGQMQSTVWIWSVPGKHILRSPSLFPISWSCSLAHRSRHHNREAVKKKHNAGLL